jgi:hypothetical protein
MIMEKKHQVHNLIILDESGSMESIKKPIISGFNELVQSIKGIEKKFPEQEHYITFVTFNSAGRKVIHFTDPVAKLKKINSSTYKPDEMTPLYDAMGTSITSLRNAIDKQTDYNVLVTVLTDGLENSSKEYTGNAIKKLVENLKMEGWTFTYIGTDHDVETVATSISITNVMYFEKDSGGVKEMFAKESNARANYSQRIRNKENTDNDFYKPDEPKKS